MTTEVSIFDHYITEVCKNETRNSLKNDNKVLRRGQDMNKYKHQLFYSNTLSADIIMRKEKNGDITIEAQ